MMPKWIAVPIVVALAYAASNGVAAEAGIAVYSFTAAPFIPPKVVADLSTWLSDGGDQVVAVNLTDSVDSNRYSGAIKTSGNAQGNPFVFSESECEEVAKESCANLGPPSFGYRLVGRADNGVYVLFTEESGGGTGRFRNLMFVVLEKDKALDYDEKNGVLRLSRERWLIRKLGEVALGDRYDGKVAVSGNRVLIAADKHDPTPGGVAKDKVIRLEMPVR